MSLAQAERLAAALLYEGYALYPYRRSSLKNRRRFDFGVVFPAGWVGAAGSDLSALRAEVLVRRGGGPVSVRVVVRFLRLVGPADEAVEEAIAAPELDLDALARRPAEPAVRAEVPARVVVRAEVEDVITARLAVDVSNTSPLVEGDREAALRASLVATHVLIEVCGARLASAIEPPAELAAAAARCRSVGLFPVLVGDPAEATAMLASPIILHDHPRVAPESPHDLYDATEIDEILTLRILTLTDAEKRLAAEDPRVAALLARVERGGVAALERLHGARRDEAPDLAPGDRVRLRPSRRADVFDLALDGKAATVASVERDLEGRAYVTVTVDDDPGADLGAHGHRFFFHPEEVERLP